MTLLMLVGTRVSVAGHRRRKMVRLVSALILMPRLDESWTDPASPVIVVCDLCPFPHLY